MRQPCSLVVVLLPDFSLRQQHSASQSWQWHTPSEVSPDATSIQQSPLELLFLMSWKDAVGYWLGQLIGAIIAGALLLLFAKTMTPGAAFAGANPAGLGANGVAGAGGAGGAFLVEVVGTFIFVLVVLGTTDPKVGVSEPCPLYRPCHFRWRTSPQGSLGIHRCPSGRRCPERSCVERHFSCDDRGKSPVIGRRDITEKVALGLPKVTFFYS